MFRWEESVCSSVSSEAPKLPPASEKVVFSVGVAKITVGWDLLRFHDIARRKTKRSALSAGGPQHPQSHEGAGHKHTTCTQYIGKHGVWVFSSLRFPGRIMLFDSVGCLGNSPNLSLPNSGVVETELACPPYFSKKWWKWIFSKISEPIFKFIF